MCLSCSNGKCPSLQCHNSDLEEVQAIEQSFETEVWGVGTTFLEGKTLQPVLDLLKSSHTY